MKYTEWFDKQINDKTIFSYVIYRRLYTPYEIEEKYMDESVYEDPHYNYGAITEYVVLPDNDILICFNWYDEIEEEFCNNYEYVKLSEIRLNRFDNDTMSEE